MPDASFIDTNIWIYAHLRKAEDPRHDIALSLVTDLSNSVISPQVAMEYYNVMLRAKQDDTWIQANLSVMLDYCQVQPLNSSVLRSAWKLRIRFGFSIWDSQILAAALNADCSILYTEDLQHGQIIEQIKIVNPFR